MARKKPAPFLFMGVYNGLIQTARISEVMMKRKSLYALGRYSLDWVKHFYDQTGIWWGADPQEEGTHTQRVAIIRRLCGTKPLRILDLGTGPGMTAAAMADDGHHVTAIEFSSTRAVYARELSSIPRKGSFTLREDDFYTVDLPEKFDLVTYWDGFGVGTDADQRRLLSRVSCEWLDENGVMLLDVFNPYKAALESGKETRLPPLKGVPGSVEMINRYFFDPEQSRWIDEWQPVDHPEQALAQTLRCYSPADLNLLLEGTGLRITLVESNGVTLDFESNTVKRGDPEPSDWSFLVKLEKA